mgnify:FL=1
MGIDFDCDLKKSMYQIQQNLKEHAIKGRWKHIDNFHLTLKFLNQVNLDQRKKIDLEMEKLCASQKVFNLGIEGLGIFQGRGVIRVLYLDLGGDLLQLQSLYAAIEKGLKSIGFASEIRKYRPHITIGQDIIFKREFKELQQLVGQFEFKPFKVNSIFLFKSEQLQSKRLYTKVSRYFLGT